MRDDVAGKKQVASSGDIVTGFIPKIGEMEERQMKQENGNEDEDEGGEGFH
jgi:hypothetical protein